MERDDIDMSIVRDILRIEFGIPSLREHLDTIYKDEFLVMYTERMDGTGTKLQHIENELYITYVRNKKIDELL